MTPEIKWWDSLDDWERDDLLECHHDPSLPVPQSALEKQVDALLAHPGDVLAELMPSAAQVLAVAAAWIETPEEVRQRLIEAVDNEMIDLELNDAMIRSGMRPVTTNDVENLLWPHPAQEYVAWTREQVRPA